MIVIAISRNRFSRTSKMHVIVLLWRVRCSAKPTIAPRILRISEFQGESNMHQIVVTILCRLRPPFPLRGIGRFPVPDKPPFLWESYYFCRISCMNPLFSPTGKFKLGAKRDAKWWPSIRCMFDSLSQLIHREYVPTSL